MFKFKEYQLNRGISTVSVATYLRNAYILLRYCMKNKWVEYFEPVRINAIKKKKKPLTAEEIKKNIEKPNPKNLTFEELRNWTAICLFADKVIRFNSAHKMKIGHLDFENDIIYVMTNKNKTPYELPMGKEIKDVLQYYLKYRGGSDDDYLFCKSNYEPISYEGLKKALTSYQIKRGVRPGIHIFRHTIATTLAKNNQGGLIPSVLGHKTDSMAKEYISIFSEDLKDVMGSYSPYATASKGKEKIKISG